MGFERTVNDWGVLAGPCPHLEGYVGMGDGEGVLISPCNYMNGTSINRPTYVSVTGY